MEPKNIDIIYENEDLLAINKPAGVVIHRENEAVEKKNEKIYLTDWILKQYPEIKTVGDDPKIRPGIVHRLDENTSGVLLIAKNQESFNYLKELFKRREIKKTYLALVYGKLRGRGTIKKPIGIIPGSTKRSSSAKKMKMIKDAVTEYKCLKIFRDENETYFTLLEVVPLTGKTHQIRVHLSSMGHPIVGDNLYGGKINKNQPIKRIFLHAYSLEFNLKNDGRIRIEADLPNELQEFLENISLKNKEEVNLINYD
jgi:23S rRNA pseudouridine1911/1915/1917 synthase